MDDFDRIVVHHLTGGVHDAVRQRQEGPYGEDGYYTCPCGTDRDGCPYNRASVIHMHETGFRRAVQALMNYADTLEVQDMAGGFATARRIAHGGDITREELENAICIALVRRGITDEGGRYTEANKVLVEQVMLAAQAYADTAARDAVAKERSQ